MCENAHGTATRAQSPEAPAAGRQTLRACAVEVHMDDVERHECTVNSSESAAHARAEQRSKHTCFSLTVRTLSVSTLFGEQAPWHGGTGVPPHFKNAAVQMWNGLRSLKGACDLFTLGGSQSHVWSSYID